MNAPTAPELLAPARSRDAHAPRISVVAYIDDPRRDPGALLVRIAKVMVGIGPRWEAIVVHDARDTAIAGRIAAWLRAPGVRLIAMPAGTSAGAAVREALALADGDLAVVLDPAMQRCPECLPELIAGWRAGADAVRLGPVEAAVQAHWPSTALYRAWAGGEGLLAGAWLGGLRLFDREVLAGLVGALESGVPDFCVWSVLTLPEGTAHPWSTMATGEAEPQRRPAAVRLGEAGRRLGSHLARIVIAVLGFVSGAGIAASRLLVAHPLGRWAAVGALLVATVLPLALEGPDGAADARRVELRPRPLAVSGIGFTETS